ncbi:MAG: (Fe-S)-binding protein [Gammaproteobacteria bacterium]|nr:(Fe-S)-binding protein [Gammaproteobacteria bacterium]MCF6229271.1 (Fe-S)-binding protein [Gammaproteobacteria bacterium]
MNISPDKKTALLKISDQCVMCGMCAPHCPTYREHHNEAESPRGRIALIQALLNDKLALDDQLKQHLDSCLSCRACEASCPSGVKYGELLDGIRAVQRQQEERPNQAKERLLKTLASGKRLRNSAKLIRLAQRSGTYALLSKGIERFIVDQPHISELLPAPLPARKNWEKQYSAIGEERGCISLFTGCIADICDQKTLQDAVTLLTHIGFRVEIPAQQACCGALHHHAGDTANSQRLAEINIEAFSANADQHIIHCATGCGAHLMEYRQQLNTSQAHHFSVKVDEISHFLLSNGIQKLAFKPLHKSVSIHLPCTQRNVLKQSLTPFELLELIPSLKSTPLADNSHCCGAAGSYMLEQPQMAQQLRQNKLDAVQQQQSQILVSSNIGCAMYLAAGIRQQGLSVEVIHPISLLVRQLIH